MAVDNQMTVDGICKGKEQGELVLLIADHLAWDDEKAHLTMLQGKINAYANFVESRQYEQVYAGEEFASFTFQIMFMHEPTERAKKFLQAASNYLKQMKVTVSSDVVG